MRTRTKYVIVAGIWLGVLVTSAVIGNMISYRPNTAAIIGVLLGSNVLQWVAHVAGVVKENISGVVRENKKGGN